MADKARKNIQDKKCSIIKQSGMEVLSFVLSVKLESIEIAIT
ncbi:Uncharacterised protein [Salmonella enterica subsp. enterica]|nr:Uncharacterised protein [Salmonella enterica subsp. enterica]